MPSKKKANKTYRHGWASEGKAKKEKELEQKDNSEISNFLQAMVGYSRKSERNKK